MNEETATRTDLKFELPIRPRGKIKPLLWPVFLAMACCMGCLPFNWAYEAYEIRALGAFVEKMGIPGTIEAVDGRNDWNSNSNGAYVRVWWIIAAEERTDLDRFVAKVRRARFPHELQAEVWKLATGPDDFLSQEPGFHAAGGLYVLRVWYVRGEQPWELGD